MEIKQINLKLPRNFVEAAQDYAEKFGFKNIQELATSCMREKIFEKNRVTNGLLNSIASEKVLAKDWLTKEEDETWDYL